MFSEACVSHSVRGGGVIMSPPVWPHVPSSTRRSLPVWSHVPSRGEGSSGKGSPRGWPSGISGLRLIMTEGQYHKVIYDRRPVPDTLPPKY